MAVTVNKQTESKEVGIPILGCIKSGETIYKGTLVGLGKDGLWYDLDAGAVPGCRMVGIVADDSANVTGPAATTASGSISGSMEVASAAAGDKTCREIYTEGKFLLTFTAIAQTDVGKTVFASDNYTVDEAMVNAVKVGSLITYISSTTGWVDLNKFYQADGSILLKYALTAVTGTTAGGILSKANPFGESVIVEHFFLDITTGSTGAANGDYGIAADGTTSSDTLIDGQTHSVVKIVSSLVNNGTNGGVRKWGATEYITGTASATMAGVVGTAGAVVRLWE